MTIPFFDLRRQYDALREEIDSAVGAVLQSQQCIGGPHVEALEQTLASRVDSEHGIGVSSGTDALLVSLMALDIGPGDEVITTPFTFFSPIGGILRRGARPVFVDIDPTTFNLDASQLESAISSETKAILPVHLFGQACDMTAIESIAARHDVAVIEDMAQAIDARHDDRPVGSFGTVGCLSFFPTKNLGAAGDAGMVFCSDDALAERIRRLCRHGTQPKYHHLEVGGNFRLDAIQASVLRTKLPYLDQFTQARRAHAAFYDRAFADIEAVTTPSVKADNHSVYNQYTIRLEGRDQVRRKLTQMGVGSNIYYPEPLHTQPALDPCGYTAGDFPEAELACREVLALPIFPELLEQERQAVAEAIIEIVEAPSD